METALLDASSLISLARIDALSYLVRLPWRLVTLAEIYHEVIIQGLAGCHPDVLIIKPYFENQSIQIITTAIGVPYSGISVSDSCVIRTGHKQRCLVISNDQGLVAKCRQYFPATNIQGSPSVILLLYQMKLISIVEARRLLQTLAKLNRVSKTNIERYLKELVHD